jgi:dTDP-4-amino-4,6-dideoxygalactose transaminase
MKREIKVARPLFLEKERLLSNISEVLESGQLVKGGFTAQFENDFSNYLGTSHAISVNSCSSALEIVLRYIEVTGGEVIIPTNTCLATANAALFAGAKPVLADIKPGTYFLDPDEVRRLISNKTRAVIVVYIAGYVPPETEEIKKICEERGIPLVEDCAQALGASYNGKLAGTFGLAGCFSFSPTKIITTGAGGMITTEDVNLNEYSRIVRAYGAVAGSLEISQIGNNWLLDEIRSCLGLNQLGSLDLFIQRRREIARYYDQILTSTDLLKKLPINESCNHVYHKYPLQVPVDIDVQDMKTTFEERYGFELESVYWPVCHLQPVYQEIFGYTYGNFPAAESILSKQITLPLHVGITDEDAEYAFECVVSEIERRIKQ